MEQVRQSPKVCVCCVITSDRTVETSFPGEHRHECSAKNFVFAQMVAEAYGLIFQQDGAILVDGSVREG
jgi:hypothetical protein